MAGIHPFHRIHILRKQPGLLDIVRLPEGVGMAYYAASLMNQLKLLLNSGVLDLRMGQQPLLIQPIDQKLRGAVTGLPAE